jgi:hypothetical protein
MTRKKSFVDPKEIQGVINDWYSVPLTQGQIKEILKQNPELVADIELCGFDTCSREWFVNAIGNWLGLKGDWPIGMDTESYTKAYFLCFKEACDTKGIKLPENWMES